MEQKECTGGKETVKKEKCSQVAPGLGGFAPYAFLRVRWSRQEAAGTSSKILQAGWVGERCL